MTLSLTTPESPCSEPSKSRQSCSFLPDRSDSDDMVPAASSLRRPRRTLVLDESPAVTTRTAGEYYRGSYASKDLANKPLLAWPY